MNDRRPMFRLAATAALLALGACSPRPAASQTAAHSPGGATVSSSAELLAALKSASAGETITLAPGLYSGPTIGGTGPRFSGVLINAFHGEVAIVGQSGAAIEGLIVLSSSGLTFRNVEFAASAVSSDPEETMPFQVAGSNHIAFENDRFHGPAGGALTSTPSGLLLRGSSYVTVADSDFTAFHNALDLVNVDHVVLADNAFHGNFDDAMRGAGSDLTIVGNDCNSNHMDAADTDHPDCIQLWNQGDQASPHDLIIADNTYEKGSGHSTQFIFIEGDAGFPRWQRVTITDNTGYGSLWNGITLSGADGASITGNRLTTSCVSDPVPGGPIVSRLVWDNLTDGLIEANAAGAIVPDAWKHASTGMTIANNTVIPCK
ncbi:MAG: right-handed parallel beta-helix repeat-containing protein [Caulobacteraceae bacterium]